MKPAQTVPSDIRRQAQEELTQEARRAAVDKEKTRLQSRSLWSRISPFVITITRRIS